MQEKSHAVFQCNTERVDLLPLAQTLSDGIQPIYLAYLYHSSEKAFQNLGLSLDKGPSKQGRSDRGVWGCKPPPTVKLG
jgi:hypothetical protein